MPPNSAEKKSCACAAGANAPRPNQTAITTDAFSTALG
jgi:hypothetical protein